MNTLRSPYDNGITILLVLFAAASMLSVAISMICLGLIGLTMIVRGLRYRDYPGNVPFMWSVGLLVLWGLLMIPFSTEPWFSLKMSKRFALYVALWVGACLIEGEDRRRLVFWAMVAGITSNAIYTLLFEEYQIDGTGRRVTMVQNSSMTGAWIMASISVLMFAFMVSLRNGRLQLLLGAAQVPILFALYLSRTRSSWVGFLAGLLIVLLIKKKRLIPVLALAVILLFVIGPPGFQTRVTSITDPTFRSNHHRIDQWKAGLELVKRSPITGIGDVYPKKMIHEFTDYSESRPTDMRHIHHSLLTAALFWGIPGLVFLLVLMGHLLVLLIRAWRKMDETEPYRQAWILGGIGMWVFYNLTGLADALATDPEMSLVFLVVVGIGIGKSDPGLSRSE